MPTAISRVSTAATIALALLLSACGGSSGGGTATASDTSSVPTGNATTPAAKDTTTAPAAAAALPDPCSLLTQSEIASTTGVAGFGDGTLNAQLSNDHQSICDWISDDPFATAQVLVGDFGDSLDSQRQSVEDSFGEATVPLDLADGAYRTQEGSIVAMKVGSLFVQVSYIPSGPGEVADQTIALAELVLGRL